MIKIKFEDKDYFIKNNKTEITIGEFEDLCTIYNDNNKTILERWCDILVYLGADSNIVDEFDAFDFKNIISNINLFEDETEKSEIFKEVDIDGKLYISYDENFKLTVKENILIDEYISKNTEKYIGELMAVIYKLEGTDKTIWYDKSHLKFKAELFRKNVTIDKIIPILNYLTRKIVNDNNLMNEL